MNIKHGFLTKFFPRAAMTALALCVAFTANGAGLDSAPVFAAEEGADVVEAMGGAIPSTLVPVGRAAGIKLFSDGVMVVGLSMVETDGGEKSPAMESGLRMGDVITKVDGKAVSSAEELSGLTDSAGESGASVVLTVRREDRETDITVTPVKSSENGSHRIGAMVRDSMAGIGTVTFYDPASGVFGALGHGICDADAGILMPLARGSVMGASVTGVKKGEVGAPGELRASFDLSGDFGTIFRNSERGIFGMATDASYLTARDAIPVAAREQIERGDAVILSNVDGGEVREYTVEITKTPDTPGAVKNMMVRVTDPELLEKTGGIVQGMSGSPIIQNGRLVGAVTHVLVNDPTRGYAIYIGDMLVSASGTALQSASGSMKAA